MELEAELYRQNPWWEKPFEERSIPRSGYVDSIEKGLANREIIFLTGLKRIGKTTIMKQLVGRLLAKGVKPADVFFINLDSFPLMGHSIHALVEKYRETHKKAAADFFYLLLDEVASRDGFEKELKSLFDNDNVKIVCSSSIATAMRDKKALLTGRTRTIEVNPLSFQEFLLFRNAEAGRADRAKLEGYFKDYMRLGGIPQYVLTEDEDYLNELVEGIIYKDIIAYHKIENEKAVKELFSLLCRRVGKPTSYNKLSKILGVSVDSVKRYVGYFEKAYLFHVVDRYAASLNESIASPKKIYAGDVGIKNLAAGGKDVGASYENLVFLKIQQDRQIKRRNRPVLLNSKPRKRVGKLSWFAIKDEKPVIGYFSENGVEIDFVTRDAAIEAKYGQKPTEKQDQVLESFKKKKDVIVASGLDFFLKKY